MFEKSRVVNRNNKCYLFLFLDGFPSRKKTATESRFRAQSVKKSYWGYAIYYIGTE